MRHLVMGAAMSFAGVCVGQEVIHLPSGFRPATISGDGRAVGGSTAPGMAKARIWTASGGLARISTGLDVGSTVWGLNQDGTVAVGSMASARGVQEPYRWTAAEGMVSLTGGLPHPSTAYGVSDDGLVVGGDRVLWTRGGGTVLINGSNDHDGPCGVSGDGRVGMGYLDGDLQLWTIGTMGHERVATGGTTGLVRMNRVGDGAAGQASRPSSVGFLWSPGRYRAIPQVQIFHDLSADGRAAVGKLGSGRPCLYTPGLGAVELAPFLQDTFGLVIPTGFGVATAISDDGRSIVVGLGDFLADGWLIRLPPARPGDFNLDEMVDFQDYVDFIDCFTGAGDIPPSAADLNHDGFVDWFDFDQFLADFGG